ncbi:MAG: hypothetical protein LC659_06735 [Myxococcales bacterium]|nr:hypothetical protein [Myxococcales bacterium]
MQSLAAKASSIELDVFDQNAACDGNDVAAGAGAPLVSRTLTGHDGTMLQLPAGHYIVVMHAFDDAGAFIGSACEAEVFTPGQHACVSVGLSTPMIDGDGGATWPPVSIGTTADLYDVWASNASDLYFVGAGGLVKHGSGTSFSTVSVSAGMGNISCVWGANSSDVYLFGASGLILHGAASGGFSKSYSPTGDYLNYGWGTPAGDVWIPSMSSTTGASTLWHSTDHGASWTSQMTTASPLWAVWASSGGDAFVVGDSILESTDSGAHWNMAGTTPQVLYGVGGEANGTGVWTVGVMGTILHRP